MLERVKILVAIDTKLERLTFEFQLVVSIVKSKLAFSEFFTL